MRYRRVTANLIYDNYFLSREMHFPEYYKYCYLSFICQTVKSLLVFIIVY